MRLFTAIGIPEQEKAALSNLLEVLKPLADFRWIVEENLHVTLKFIGEWPNLQTDRLGIALRGLASRPPIPIRLSGLGWFPNPHSPRVLFARVTANAKLGMLAAEVDEVLGTAGVTRETKPYQPHVTLARVSGSGAQLAAARQAIAKLETTDFGSFEANSFGLYRSEPGEGGPIYTLLAEFRL